MTGKVCGACDRPLEGRATKWCTDADCKRERTRWAWILAAYGLTKDDYQMILEHQKGLCPITGRPLGGAQATHIDHDHSSGHVRGIVTAYANTRLIGRLRNWQTAQNLADYLRDPPATKALGRPVVAPKKVTKRRKKRKR